MIFQKRVEIPSFFAILVSDILVIQIESNVNSYVEAIGTITLRDYKTQRTFLMSEDECSLMDKIHSNNFTVTYTFSL